MSRSITTVVIPISIHAPLTGSDWSDFRASPNRPDFNPRSPYGERPCLRKPYCDGFSISIHAPLTGSDKEKFAESQTEIISIHAPLTGSDFALCCFSFKFADFNPRSPYGERLMCNRSNGTLDIFQSTLPLRGATGVAPKVKPGDAISIHAPLTGSDSALSEYRRVMLYFNPRSPYGERLQLIISLSPMRDFNPRSPYGERP